MSKIDHVNLIMKVVGSLSDLPINIQPKDLEREMWANTNSKYSNSFNIEISSEHDLNDGIVCVSNSGGTTQVKLMGLKNKKFEIPNLKDRYKDTEIFEISGNSILMFPSNINHEISGEGTNKIIFKVNDKKDFGHGENKYRVEVTFSDTYYIIVNADNEEKAKQIAYDINTSNWIHEWPHDPDLEKTQVTRMSKWGRKSLKAYQVE